MSIRVNPWLVFVFFLTLVFAATTQAQDDIFDPTESYRATDDDGNTTRITPSALGGFNATDSKGNVTRIRPSALGGYNATDSEGNTTRIKPTGFGSRSSYDRTPVDADDSVSSSLGPVVPSSPPYAYSRHSPVTPQQREGGSHDTRHPSEDDGFAAASGKCGDVTTQKIGSFYYHSGGKPCEDDEEN